MIEKENKNETMEVINKTRAKYSELDFEEFRKEYDTRIDNLNKKINWLLEQNTIKDIGNNMTFLVSPNIENFNYYLQFYIRCCDFDIKNVSLVNNRIQFEICPKDAISERNLVEAVRTH